MVDLQKSARLGIHAHLPSSGHRPAVTHGTQRRPGLDQTVCSAVLPILVASRTERRRTPCGPGPPKLWAGVGQCIDRYYIERFLLRHAADISGDVLEFQDRSYTVRFGKDRVTRADVLDLHATNPHATLIGDLTQPDALPSARFNCIIATQVLQYPYDVRAAVHTLFRMLKPKGVLLGSAPGICQMPQHRRDRSGDHWRFTASAVQALFSECFGAENVEVTAHGNVLVATAFLHGLVVEELDRAVLEIDDPEYQLTVTVRAMRP